MGVQVELWLDTIMNHSFPLSSSCLEGGAGEISCPPLHHELVEGVYEAWRKISLSPCECGWMCVYIMYVLYICVYHIYIP